MISWETNLKLDIKKGYQGLWNPLLENVMIVMIVMIRNIAEQWKLWKLSLTLHKLHCDVHESTLAFASGCPLLPTCTGPSGWPCDFKNFGKVNAKKHKTSNLQICFLGQVAMFMTPIIIVKKMQPLMVKRAWAWQSVSKMSYQIISRFLAGSRLDCSFVDTIILQKSQPSRSKRWISNHLFCLSHFWMPSVTLGLLNL